MRMTGTAALLLCAVLMTVACAALAEDSATSQPSSGWLSLAPKPAAPGSGASQDSSAEQSPSPATAEVAEPSAPAKASKAGSSFLTEKPWEIKFKAYMWVPEVNGRAGRGANVAELDIDYHNVFESLDEIESMVPVDLEVRYGHWGFIADLLYVKLEDQIRKGPAVINLEADQTILELTAYYRIDTWLLPPKCGKSLTVDILGGARYNRLNGAVGLQAPNAAISIGHAQEWWDPIVGPRVIWQATDQLSIFARGDVGGFGIENCSHFAWQFLGGLEYDFTKNVFIELGYRLLDTNFESGSGADHFTFDVRMAGPYMALGVKF